MTKPKTIIHFNHNTARNVNVGDEAHVLAIQDSIRALPGMQDVVFVNKPIDDLSVWQLPVGTPMIRRWPVWIHDLYRYVRGNTNARLVAECNQADLVLIGGGGVYMEYILPYDTQIFKDITVPLVIHGVGYNRNFGAPDFSVRQIESIVRMGHQAALQSVRDASTHDFLAQHGVESTLLCDPAMFLQGAQTIKNIPADGPNIGLNIAAHGWKQEGLYLDALVDMYAEACQKLAKTYNAHFYYIVHHPNELGLAKRLQDKSVELEIVQGDARVLKGAYEQLDVTISMMLHSTILAFGSQTPSICIGYDKKNLAFMELIDQEDNYIDVSKVTSEMLYEKIVQCLKQRELLAAQLSRSYDQLKAKSQAFTEQIGALLTA